MSKGIVPKTLNMITYAAMTLIAVGSLSPRNYKPASRAAIKNYISANFYKRFEGSKITQNQFNIYARKALARHVEKGYITQTKQSFKLTPEGRKHYKVLREKWIGM